MKGYLLVLSVFVLGWWVGECRHEASKPVGQVEASRIPFQVRMPELRSVGSVQSVIERSR